MALRSQIKSIDKQFTINIPSVELTRIVKHLAAVQANYKNTVINAIYPVSLFQSLTISMVVLQTQLHNIQIAILLKKNVNNYCQTIRNESCKEGQIYPKESCSSQIIFSKSESFFINLVKRNNDHSLKQYSNILSIKLPRILLMHIICNRK
ncbi:unnamed protein product (macronuclear) [Paramecium tetraurelia]|uniref:Uncharacterized protein n=1 Tax=Paramecium tetraurelia TaxID=5888 RepID=A0DU70_PARTE|nr:uncharacterized protein GSPATT00020258001 [Paramecium tetraurelia]CAK86587.1 unnamed protein product [Paramecium tetraurelia]|eukprot:XP_001453984.1 hypothetical protein (macronuclear) [Paramecium tetraurelia strain d4-2]